MSEQPVYMPREPTCDDFLPCWCCAMWGIATAGTCRRWPGMLCDQCAGSEPDACNSRHEDQVGA